VGAGGCDASGYPASAEESEEVGSGSAGMKRLLSVTALTLLAVALLAGAAQGATPHAGWIIKSVGLPTRFSTNTIPSCEEAISNYEDCDGFSVTAMNVGSTESSGEVVIRDTLPAGVVIEEVPGKLARVYEPGNEAGQGEKIPCEFAGLAVTCRVGPGVQPGGVVEFFVEVKVTAAPGASLLNSAELEEVGGAAGVVRTGSPGTVATPVDGGVAGFGVNAFTLGAFGLAGEPDVQAGDHPSTVVTTVAYNTILDTQVANLPYETVQEPDIVNTDLPMGFVGDALSAPQCSEAALAAGQCPVDTRVGIVGIFKGELNKTELLYLYNVTPEAGYPVQFGFNLYKTVVMLRGRVLPSAAGYVVSVPVPGVPRSQSEKLHEVSVLFFGDPGASDGVGVGDAFATVPESCGGGPLMARLEMDSWDDPGDWQSAEAPMFSAGVGQGVVGCGALSFDPSLQVSPETTSVDSPSGFEVGVGVPQSPDVIGDLASPDLKGSVVGFPEGVSLSPGAANGLVACPESGPEGIAFGDHDRVANENMVEEGEELGADGLVHPAAGHCPQASEIGEAEAVSPILAEPLRGHLFVAEPACGNAGQEVCSEADAANGKLFGVYLELSGEGVIIKLKGMVSVNPQTGRVTTSFQDLPEQPVSNIRLKLNGGPRASLATSQSCGQATTTSDLTPSSSPYTPDAQPFSSYTTTACSNVFAPGFLAESTSSVAAVFSPFTLTLRRPGGEQDLGGVSVVMPGGLLGRIAGVGLCPEPAAGAGTCGVVAPGSRVGSVVAAAGSGAAPFWQSGQVFLTGAFGGGPFGLSIVVPADAGPYHLGDIVVRSSIRINPVTAAVSVVTGALPQMVDGVPLRVQAVNVTVGGEKPFTFNPTNCDSAAVTGTVTGAQGASANVSAPFAATGCAALPFKPVFSASTAGQATKAHGAGLLTKLVFPAAAAGSASPEVDANVAAFKVELPRQLPSRNTTLQKACLAAVFDANPAGCPAASNIGSVLAHTPVLSGALAGPVYLVSYGGEKFPQIVMILQGEGVTVDLTGTIYVSKAGITSITLKTVPDAPVSSFELKTPKGPFSALTSYVPAKDEFNLCGQSLVMPTTITAQNGAVVKQATRITITGCPKHKAKKKAKGKKAAVKSTKKGG
jgi:hypothetical protein